MAKKAKRGRAKKKAKVAARKAVKRPFKRPVKRPLNRPAKKKAASKPKQPVTARSLGLAAVGEPGLSTAVELKDFADALSSAAEEIEARVDDIASGEEKETLRRRIIELLAQARWIREKGLEVRIQGLAASQAAVIAAVNEAKEVLKTVAHVAKVINVVTKLIAFGADVTTGDAMKIFKSFAALKKDLEKG